MAMRKKLVIAACVDLAQLNAPAIHLVSLVRVFIEQGYEIILIIPDFTGPAALSLPQEHLLVERTKRLRISAIPNGLNVLAQIPALWHHRHFRPAYVRTAPLSFVLSGTARLFGYKKIVLEINGWFADELASLGHRALIAKTANFMQILEAKLASRIRVVTPGLKSLLLEAGVSSDRVEVISAPA